jgi:hypothetical protein
MTVDMNAVRERIRVEQERQREAQDWFRHRSTWKPVHTEEQKREQEEYIKKHNLPF